MNLSLKWFFTPPITTSNSLSLKICCENVVKKISEDPIREENLEVEIVETIKEEIIEEVVNDLDEVKLDDCNVQAPITLVGDTETKFINFIGVERFDVIIDSYLVNIVNCMKIKGQEVQVAQSMKYIQSICSLDMKDFKFQISNFKNKLKDEFVSSGGVWCKKESTI